ncbi:MAG: D-aminoacyl-tRNA deacylase, partial [Frankia sp.]
MRAVVQRVTRAAVTVDNEQIAEIGPGLLLLVGVAHTDQEENARSLARKAHHLRILAGERSAAQTGSPLLVVSQFTLLADTRKGRRPSWAGAAPAEIAEPLINAV